jgi:glycosyltransferase involved in cell wall biosynthesis
MARIRTTGVTRIVMLGCPRAAGFRAIVVDLSPIAAVIPAYQEGPRIGAVVRATVAFLPVVVVDDGSADDTAEQAERAGAIVVRQVPNQGKGAALRTGFRFALDHAVEAVVTLDADGQHDPDEIPHFCEAFERAHPGLVIGRRDFAAMPVVRRVSNSIGRLILSTAIGRDIPDNQSGYRLIGSPLMRALLDSREQGFEFEVEMIARCIALELPIAWVPVRTIYAGEPSHIRPLAHFTNFLRVARQARRTVRGR